MSEKNFNFGELLNQNAKKFFSSEEQNSTGPKQSEIDSAASDPVEQDKKIYKKRTRNKNLALKFTAEEIEEINQKIEKSKLSKTDFILNCIREKDVIVIDDLTAALVEVRKQGININQIARALNTYVLDLEQLGVVQYSYDEDFKRFASEIEGLRKENAQTLKLLNLILQKVGN